MAVWEYKRPYAEGGDRYNVLWPNRIVEFFPDGTSQTQKTAQDWVPDPDYQPPPPDPGDPGTWLNPPTNHGELMSYRLGVLGQKGWEIVGIASHASGSHVIYLKREVPT